MTREEAIDLIDNLIGMVADNQNSDYDTALKMGIKALEQEPFINKPCVSSEVCEHDKQIVLDKIREQIKSYLRGVEITLEVLVENDPLIPKMEGAKDTLEECLEFIDKAEAEADNG